VVAAIRAILDPALADLSGLLVTAWTGTEPANHHNHAAPHGNLAQNQPDVHYVQHTRRTQVCQATDYVNHVWPNEPAIVGFNGDLYGATYETSSHSYIQITYSSDGGKHWFHGVKVPANTDFAPALTTFDGKLYLAWTETDPVHCLNVESSSDGAHWDNPVTLEGASGAPALAASEGCLHLSWAGTDQENHINEHEAGHRPVAGLRSGPTLHRMV
jgi:hypothetical protein